jgi:hypothetical protein
MDCRAIFLPVLIMAVSAYAQTAAKPIQPNGPAHSPNSQGTYAALRADLPGSEGVTVKDFTLEREGGKFTFEQGDFYFYSPVEGRVTGAVFVGKGRFDLTVKDAGEQRSLAQLTKSVGMTQEFTTLVLRFTDGTADEIRKASAGASGAPAGHVRGAGEDLVKGFRKDLHENLELRLLADVIGGGNRGEFFLASFHMGNLVTGRNVLFIVDPEGTFHASPDEVELTTWSEFDVQPWAAYRMQHVEEKDRGKRVQVMDERLDVTIDRGGMMKTSAETTMKVLHDGVRVVQLNLYSSLRVTGVYSESGAPLDFVQEDKLLDPKFAVILPAAAKRGDMLRLLTVYSGKDALRADGNDTYYLMSGARESWYPSGEGGLGNFTNFHMTFHIPKILQIVATGKQVSLTPESGGMVKAVWETDAPIPVAGFNLGDFKMKDAKTPQGFTVSAYADQGLPDTFARLPDLASRAHVPLGNLSTVGALPVELSQGSAAIQIYSDFFGKLPYDHVALTEQTACNYGQSWPMLVYLPICGFWDTTVQHVLGLDYYDASYWREVTPHEVSHQWWGQLVGFSSYRDQWMSEGFANFSVGVFLLNTSPNMDLYRAFWKEQQKNLLQKNAEGKRPIDVGALTMGERVSNEKNGNVYQLLIYSKGAYVLHMLEMAYWTPNGGEAAFKNSMQQFVKEYSGKAATTEDWKASMEKTMPKWMDLKGDGKLDWFFDEYVYGTELPHYAVTSEFSVDADGATSVHVKLTQSNVSEKFVMRVPLYLQMQNGTTTRIANLVLHGSNSIDHTFVLGKLPSPGKTILVNYNADVLSDN